MNTGKKIVVVLPAYNVANSIEVVIGSLPDYISWIIVVNDGSRDDTEPIVLKLAQENGKIIYIRHELNQGVGAAMITGFKRSMELNADITIKMDSDGQMDVDYLTALIRPLEQNKADYTKGNRFRDFRALKQMPILRRIGNLGLSFFIKAASGYWNIFDPCNGFVAINNDTLVNIELHKIHNRYFFETSMLIQLYRSNAVVLDVPMKARYGNEKSGLSVTKTLFEFPPRLFIAFIKRVILKYFLYDFNIASIYLLCGLPIFIYGIVFGIVNFLKYAKEALPAPTGTVVIPTLLIILGFQLLLSAVSYDISNYPKK